MSVTSRTLKTGIMVGQIDATGSVSGTTTKLTLHYYNEGDDGIWIGAPTTSQMTATKIKINGTQVSATWKINKSKYVPLSNATYTVDATCTITVSKAFFDLYIGGIFDFTTEDFSFYQLENAPNEVDVNGSEMNGSTKSTISLDNNTSDATYNVTWAVKTKSYSQNFTGSSASYAIPASWCDVVNTSEKETLTATVKVYFGGTLFKTISGKGEVTVPDEYVPTISSITMKDGLKTVPTSWCAFVQFYSKIALSEMTYVMSHSAAITKIQLTIDDRTYSGTPDSYPVSNTITEYGAIQCTVTITDQRGRTASKSCDVNVLPYDMPRFKNVMSQRCDQSGSVDNDGTYCLTTTQIEYSRCNGFNKTKLTVQYKLTSKYFYGAAQEIQDGDNVIAGDMDGEFSYDVKYILSDQFNTVTYIDYVSTAVFLMHFLHGGRGVAFGQKATMENTADFAFDARFRGAVVFERSNGEEVTAEEMIANLSSKNVAQYIEDTKTNTDAIAALDEFVLDLDENKMDGTQKLFTWKTYSVSVGTLAAGATKYDQTTAITAPDGYTNAAISAFYLTGTNYTKCTITKVNVSGNNLLWSVQNLGTTATGTLTLYVTVMQVRTANK